MDLLLYIYIYIDRQLCSYVILWLEVVTNGKGICLKLLYSGKFLKGLSFKNFESSQAFSKIFFEINSYHARALPECFVADRKNGTSEIF